MNALLQDARFAFRALRKAPGFTAIAVLSLALGVGANTAVFSVVHAVLLRPLPYPEPDRLVEIGGAQSGGDVTIPEFEFWKQNSASVASAAGHRGVSERRLAAGGRQEFIGALSVTADFFRTLGVPLALGREFTAEETRPTGPQAIVLSDGLWRRAFAADPGVIGSAVTVDDQSFVVVGVARADFWFPEQADAFVPLRPSGSLSDRGYNTTMLARLKPGVAVARANAEFGALMEAFRRANLDPNADKNRRLTATPYQESLTGDVRGTLWLLLGAVVLLLLIACSNLGSLLLARFAARQKEIAIRLALGSGAGRLLRQFLIEGLMLAFTGAAAGFLSAYWSLGAILALVPFNLRSATPIRVDSLVLGFAAGIAALTAVVFSLPAWAASRRMDLQETLKAAARSGGNTGPRQRARSFLIIGEVALSVTLLVSAALLIQSLYRLHQEHLGFNPQGVLTFSLPRPQGGWRSGPDQRNFEAAVLDRLRATPGVRGVAAVNALPLTGQSNFPCQQELQPDHSIGGMEVRRVTPEYLETMGIAIVRGRGIRANDAASAPPVVLISETVARTWWPQGNAIGDRVLLGYYKGKLAADLAGASREVVGIVADTKALSIKRPPRPTLYVAAAQSTFFGQAGMNWVIRGAVSAQQLRDAVTQIEPRQKIERLRPMEAIVSRTTADSRFDAWLFGLFAALALLLTAVGVYGLLAFQVARRTNEIGTRMALGASRIQVLRMVLGQGLGLIAVGLSLGLVGSFVATRWLEKLLFGVRPTDPASFAAVAFVLVAVGFAASYVPARRATRVDPMVALRYE